MKRTFLTTILLICCFLTDFAAIADFSGMWTGTLKTDTGEVYPLLYNFKVEGDKLTGTAKTPKGELPIDDGKITGTDFKFTVVLGDMEIEHTGKFYGDSVGVDIALGDNKAHTTLLRQR